MTSRALVTGASGFVGSRLTHALRQAGWHVDALVRPGSDLGSLSADAVHICEAATVEELSRIVACAQPDVVFHLASLFIAEHRSTEVSALLRSNIEFGTLLLDAMATNGTQLLVNAGTSWQHFHTSDYSPACLYAATKQAFEAILQFYVEARGMRCVTLKLSDSYGPGDRRRKLLSLLQQVASTGQAMDFSAGEQYLDLLHIDDVVCGFVTASERLRSGATAGHETFALTSGAPLRLRDLIARFEQECGRPLPLRLGARPYRAREVMLPWTEGTRLPGWHPQIALDQGLREMLEGGATLGAGSAA